MIIQQILQLCRMTLFMWRALTTIESKSFLQKVNFRQNGEDLSEPVSRGTLPDHLMKPLQLKWMSWVRFIRTKGVSSSSLIHFDSQGSAPEEFERPTDITVNAKGNIYVIDFGNNRIQKFAPLISQTKNE